MNGLESLGTGGLGGLIVASLSALGLWSKVEKKLNKETFDTFLNFCNERHKIVESMRYDIAYIKERMDSLNDFLRNHK